MLFFQLLQKCDQEYLIESRASDKTASCLLYFKLPLDRQEVWKERKALLWHDCHSPRWRGRLQKTWDLMLDEHRLETLFAKKTSEFVTFLSTDKALTLPNMVILSLVQKSKQNQHIFVFQDLQQEQLSAPLTCCQWHENWSSGRKVGACQFLLVIDIAARHLDIVGTPNPVCHSVRCCGHIIEEQGHCFHC